MGKKKQKPSRDVKSEPNDLKLPLQATPVPRQRPTYWTLTSLSIIAFLICVLFKCPSLALTFVGAVCLLIKTSSNNSKYNQLIVEEKTVTRHDEAPSTTAGIRESLVVTDDRRAKIDIISEDMVKDQAKWVVEKTEEERSSANLSVSPLTLSLKS